MDTQDLNMEVLHEKRPDLIAAIEARARQGLFTQAGLDEAVAAARDGLLPSAEVEQRISAAVAKAVAETRESELSRIMAIHASCKGSNTMVMFQRLATDGCTEQQANDRIQDALAMASDDESIVSRVSGGGFPRAKKMPSATDIYAERAGREVSR